MGSPEGYTIATNLIEKAIKDGNWVILKNIHLIPRWVKEFEEYFYKQTPNKTFRIFLTMEYSDRIDSSMFN